MDGSVEKTTAKQSAHKDDAALLKRLEKNLKRAKKARERYGKRAEEGVKFYFDDQWEDEAKQEVEGRKQPVITNNRIKPVVKVVLGMMIGRPLDWLAKPVGKNDDDLAEAATAALKYVSNRSKLRHILKEVYRDALLAGVGWCQIGPYVRVKDPRREIVQHRRIDWREAYPDPMHQEADGSDMRWFIWRRKVDEDEFFDKYGKKLKRLAGQTEEDQPTDADGVIDHPGQSGVTPPPASWDAFAGWNLLDKEAGDEEGCKQILVNECWEVRPTKVWLYEEADGQPIEFPGPDDPEGVRIILAPTTVSYYEDEVPKVWRHVWSGKALLESEASKHKHDRIPFVPLYYERDHNGDPVSFVESLKDMQREVNYRRSKMLHELQGPQMAISAETLVELGMTLDEATAHAAKPNAVWPADPAKIAYLTRGNTASQQFDLMLHGEEAIQKNGAVNDHIMGYDGPAESGKSKEISVQQGATSQRDAEENLLTFHQTVGELTLSDIQAWHKDQWTVRITDDVGKDKLITLNAIQHDTETGLPRVIRDINAMPMEIEIDSMPWTVTLRQRAFETINDMANQEQDPILRMAFRRMAFTVGDLPERAKLLDILTGAEQQSQMAQQQAAMQQQAQQQAQMEQDMAMAAMKQGPPPMPPGPMMPPAM